MTELGINKALEAEVDNKALELNGKTGANDELAIKTEDTPPLNAEMVANKETGKNPTKDTTPKARNKPEVTAVTIDKIPTTLVIGATTIELGLIKEDKPKEKVEIVGNTNPNSEENIPLNIELAMPNPDANEIAPNVVEDAIALIGDREIDNGESKLTTIE